MTTVVDTNILRAADIVGHVHHDLALDALTDATPPLIVPDMVLAEILVDLDPGDWDPYVEALGGAGFSFVPFDPFEAARSRRTSIADPPRLKMPDACIIAAATASGADTIATFDSALRKAATARGLAVLPQVMSGPTQAQNTDRLTPATPVHDPG